MSHFEPSIERARQCRLAMDSALWSSVDDLLAEQGIERADSSESADNAPTSLLDYGAYFDLALVPPALEEVPEEARAFAIARLGNRRPERDDPDDLDTPIRIRNYAPDQFSSPERAMMERWWDIEPANRMAITAAGEDEVARSRSAIATAMTHLSEAEPDLHGEVEVIVRDIVLTRPDGTNRINYSGASSFALWGAMTINAETQCDWTQMYRQIVHETGHNLLFAIARDEPLVTNNPGDRRPSPIRADLRPMDGIFHAAYVSAREARAFEALLVRNEKVANLSEDDRRIIEDLLEMSVLAFWDCVTTLRQDGSLTSLGHSVLGDCEAWMTANFAVEPC